MGTFEEEMARQRAAHSNAMAASNSVAEAERQRREVLRSEASRRALELLPELEKAIGALQAAAYRTTPYYIGEDVRAEFRYGSFNRRKLLHWTVNGQIRVPVSGKATAQIPDNNDSYSKKRYVNLRNYAIAGFFWWSTTERSSATVTNHTMNAAEVFEAAIKAIAAYLVKL